MTTSVVIPTRNRGTLLVESVESALAAGVVDEVVVVDGGSTDGSLAAVRALGAGVRIVEGRYPNAAATRNAGVAVARGSYLAFLDSDDLMLPEKLTHLAPLLDGDPAIALAHGSTTVIDESGQPSEAATAAQHAELAEGRRRGTSYVALAEYCAMYTSATLVRRSAFEAVGGYDESLPAYEDWDLYLRLARRFRLVYDSCVVARYRVWGGNVAWDRTADGIVRVAEKHLAALDDLPAAERAEARYAFLRRLAAANHILIRTGASRRAALAAMRIAPARGLRDRDVRAPFFRSFLPQALLRHRRPPR